MFIKNTLDKAQSFLFGMLGAMVVLSLSHYITNSYQTILTVNITGLVNQFIQQESSKNLAPDVLKQEINVFGHQLEKNLIHLAKQKNAILVPSEAVIAGSHDETATIKKMLLEGKEDVK